MRLKSLSMCVTPTFSDGLFSTWKAGAERGQKKLDNHKLVGYKRRGDRFASPWASPRPGSVAALVFPALLFSYFFSFAATFFVFKFAPPSVDAKGALSNGRE